MYTEAVGFYRLSVHSTVICILFYTLNRAFSHDVLVAILVFSQNKEMAAILMKANLPSGRLTLLVCKDRFLFR